VSERVQLVVLDDDPTGIQTVHGCLLFTRWSPETLRAGFEDDAGFFYVLTNTRAYDRSKARRIVREVVHNVLELNRDYGYSLIFVSRSDSTLRSQFPTEIDVITRAVEAEQGRPPDAVFMVPAFFEGGRLTVGDTHYVEEGGVRTPAHETEYARDSVFGYGTSHLPSYIQEKTAGRVDAAAVQSISLELLRGEPDGLKDFLRALSGSRFVVVNAERYEDLDRFSEALLAVAAEGKLFAFQSAASVVKTLAGVPDKPLLGADIAHHAGNGLFVVGSHVQKTTEQLGELLKRPGVRGIEADVRRVLGDGESMLRNTAQKMQDAWQSEQTPVVYTSREELTFDSKKERLEAGRQISALLASLVRQLGEPLPYLVAKGGITSHDVLMQGLRVARAQVLGQILPGVPVIAAPRGNRFEGMPYVIFPGNVGGDRALVDVYKTLDAGAEQPR